MKTIHVYGAGLSGLTAARILTDKGYKVVVHEPKNYIGGALKTYRQGDTEVHQYGAHIFHTDDERVNTFIHRFEEWVEYKHRVQAFITIDGHERLVQLPLSNRTLKDLYDTNDMDLIKYTIGSTSGMKHPDKKVQGLIDRIGWDAFTYLIKGYSELQWGCNIEDVPGGAVERIGYKPNESPYYFTDKYQLLPKNGYDEFIKNLSTGLDIRLNDSSKPKSNQTFIFTGSLDELFDYKFGALRYRSLTWERVKGKIITKLPVLNTPTNNKSTRTIYHHNFRSTKTKVVTREYPCEWCEGKDRYYPINDTLNTDKYNCYLKEFIAKYPDGIALGRLGTYKYLDMDDTIAQAIDKLREL